MTTTEQGVPVLVTQAWTCFHCGETFTDERLARDHFGPDLDAEAACRIKAGAERGLLTALRRAERDLNDMRRALADEATDAARAYYAQTTRHHEQLRAAEELGYERGLADARAETLSAEQTINAELVEALEAAEPLLETLHSLTLPDKGARKIVWRDLQKVRAALRMQGRDGE